MYDVFLWLLPSSQEADIALLLEAETALDAMLQAMQVHQLVYVDYASAWPLTDEQAKIVRCFGVDILGSVLDVEVL